MRLVSMSFIIMAVATAWTSRLAAAEPAPNANDLITPSVIAAIHKWCDAEIVLMSTKAQNAHRGELAQTEIDALDKQWRAEREKDDKPLISATLSNPLSIYLNRVQARSLGLYAEIFVMDRHGLNVGQSSITTDFWQGDEAKFQKTFDIGPDAVFVDEPEWDKEFKIWRGQVSFTLNDPRTKTKIGAVTVELNLTELARRKDKGA